GTDTVLDEEAGDVLTDCEISGAPPIVVNVTSDEEDTDLEDTDCDVDAEETGEQCTLRAALQVANSQGGENEINFAIEPAGQATIAPEAELPAITEGVEIHGGTQPGAPTGEPGVIVDGSQIEAGPRRAPQIFTLRISNGNGTILEQLGFTGSLASAIGVDLDAQFTTLDGLLVGLTDMFASATTPNALDGIYVEGSDTTIRDSVISGNGRHGVHLAGSSRFTKLINNTIGPLGPLEGLASLGPITNEGAGIAIAGGSSENVIGGATFAEGNTIGRNGIGVLMDEAGRANEVTSNEIGAPHAGGLAVELLANEGEGIKVTDTRLDEGDELEITTNTIANNGGDGIRMEDSTGADITGNALGALMSETDCTHVLIDNELRQIHVEVAEDVERSFGIPPKRFLGGGGVNLGKADGQLLEALGGNLICDENGEAIGFAGILTAQIEANVIFGGAMLENLEGMFSENIVSDSEGAGVELGKGTEVELAENLFVDNAGRPIVLRKGDAQAVPDPLDPDKGPNQLQNYPLLGFFQTGPTQSTSRFSLLAAKKGQFRLEFFGADSCSPEGRANVHEFLGSEVVETSPAGLVNGVATLPAGAEAYAFVTTTATRLDVPNPMTSEVGPCIATIPADDSGFGLTLLDPFVKKGKVKTMADCVGSTACAGEAEITDRDGSASYGSAEIEVAAGDAKQIKIKANRKLERLLKKKGRAEVILTSTTDEVRSTALVLVLKN
ncbi:MAG TPA: right-handed parallel beta-helix repeat-containing protein, partial [Actinomycetota bacterium]|nr:right-handed parallel beta-helix repeat-containing protein [Actinomycetota bacterium]